MWVPQREYRKLGAILRDVRIGTELSQAELAKRLRKPQSFISSYEAGQRRVDILELTRIAVAMDVNPVELFRKAIRYASTG